MKHRLIAILVAQPILLVPLLIAQQKTSEPISEVTIKAGQSFEIDVHLEVASNQALWATVNYQKVVENKQQGYIFSCNGQVPPNQLKFTLSCSTDRKMPDGEYRSDGNIELSRYETGESRREHNRLPIIRIDANPYDATQFPVIAGTTLSLNAGQALTDGVVRAQVILSSLSTHFPTSTRDSRDTRLYIRQEVDQARTVVAITRTRYASAIKSGAPLPVFFEDLDLRLNKVIKELGGQPTSLSSIQQIGVPHLVLAQLPKTSESVEATTQSGTLEKHTQEFIAILNDMINGWKEISDSGITYFMWSVETTPPGAELWISRFGKPETQWAGVTNIRDQKLEFATWTFRVNWNGCSESQTPDPYGQKVLTIEMDKKGCRHR